MRGLLTDERCEEIKELIVEMYEETEIDICPIDCFEVAKRLHYIVRAYSTLMQEKRREALRFDPDGYSKVEKNSATGMYEYVIYYNDITVCNEGRIRMTIFHEIGHCYLGHHDNPDDSNSEIEEAEAKFFAKYAIAPPPLINVKNCEDMWDVQNTFKTSGDASYNIFDYFQKWLQYGPRNYMDYEIHLLELFHCAA